MPEVAAQKSRPQYRNIHVTQIWRYRLPPPGIVSILHRISGSIMFLVGIPFVLYLFQQSLTSEISFQSYKAIVGSLPGKLVLLVLIWAFTHHALSGIRHLMLDRHVGIQKHAANRSATIVLGAEVVIVLVLALRLFGAF